jgi:geranylgeranyl diphosphate synthase, type II
VNVTLLEKADRRDPLADLRGPIEEALQQAVVAKPGSPARLTEAMAYSVLAPGKRLRPALVLAAFEACDGDWDDLAARQSSLAACVSVELIHAYSLIHDDLPAMDDDDLRRGRPTCHKKFDEATAILAGDALQAMAFEQLATKVFPGDRAAACVATLATASGPTGLVGGQADDLEAEGKTYDLDWLEAIHRRKTGALIAASLRLGGLTAGATVKQLDALARYADGLGLAFQIVDDLLDVQGNAEEVGKRTGKDAAIGKLTYPGLLGIDESRARAAALVADACSHAKLLGTNGLRLVKLAEYVLDRSR